MPSGGILVANFTRFPPGAAVARFLQQHAVRRRLHVLPEWRLCLCSFSVFWGISAELREAVGSRSAAPAPVAAPPSPPPMASSGGGGGFMSNMVGNVASGMASGVGFGVAQRAVDAVMGPRSMEVVHTNSSAPVTAPQPQMMQQNIQQNPCAQYQEDLNQCMTRHTDITLCQNYLDNLKACQMNMNRS
ncbi:CHCH domain-containing protein, putative [Eimeria mitis]|uniref:CHCH domain-containing protein, putative n=1 Tax=Eimeria mitis TaxID=44415 RepID=U6KE33_9EIME|nr:CHCH domain-containing protein, putative [Eimeria mitis]CDJ34492.1 CHCH domain-containing protein, putative [Eimeria mitis]